MKWQRDAVEVWASKVDEDLRKNTFTLIVRLLVESDEAGVLKPMKVSTVTRLGHCAKAKAVKILEQLRAAEFFRDGKQFTQIVPFLELTQQLTLLELLRGRADQHDGGYFDGGREPLFGRTATGDPG